MVRVVIENLQSGKVVVMIKNLRAYVMVVLVALGVTACGVGDEELTPGEDVGVGVIEIASPEEVAIPAELSLDSLSPQDVGAAAACSVRLNYCRDPQLGLPSYCHRGTCTEARRKELARSLCERTCGNINCGVRIYEGRC